ncbi:hypothetical protein F5Y16DRAFT_421782 [Xylariaceae sp. FL0255]|nr:hypothetical protein F5Y16DRAFT_421782 [Xylariaceae sp. FL0255]
MLIPMKRLLNDFDEGGDIEYVTESFPKRFHPAVGFGDNSTPGLITDFQAPTAQGLSGNSTSLETPYIIFGPTPIFERGLYDDATLIQADSFPPNNYEEFHNHDFSTNGVQYPAADGHQDHLDVGFEEVQMAERAGCNHDDLVDMSISHFINQDDDGSRSWASHDFFDTGYEEIVSRAGSNLGGSTPKGNSSMDLDVVEQPLDSDAYDICLGCVLLDDVQVRQNSHKAKEDPIVLLETLGEVIVLRESESKAYLGLLNSKVTTVLKLLWSSYRVNVTATLHNGNQLELLFYTTDVDCDKIGDFLSQYDWYLQQPESYDPSTTYHNPQWLTRPGVQFEATQIEAHHQSKSTLFSAPTVDEKNKFDEVLDSATGPAEFRRARASDLLTTQLKEHQVKALSFMCEKECGILRDAEFPSLWCEVAGAQTVQYINNVTSGRISRKPQLCLGGLLADDMGLGKTLTTLALIAGSIEQRESVTPSSARATLIATPLSTLPNWEDQIKKHSKPGSLTVTTYHGPTRRNYAQLQAYDIVLTTFDILRTEWSGLKYLKKGDVPQRGLLHDIDWYRVVLDEAHVIRNRKQNFQACRDLKAVHRWCLTGTPIQNTVEDLGAIVQFLRVYPFDTSDSFKNTFIDRATGRVKSWERLRALVQAISLRRTKASVGNELNIPPRQEIIHRITLNQDERHVYHMIKRNFSFLIGSRNSTSRALALVLRLRQVCDHGRDLLPTATQEWLEKASLYRDRSVDLALTCENCDNVIKDSDCNDATLSCLHQICQACARSTDAEDRNLAVCPICTKSLLDTDSNTESSNSHLHMEDGTGYRPSTKVVALLRSLKNDSANLLQGQAAPKSVVFSAWTTMLNLIGKALMNNNIRFQRLDGSCMLTQRREAISIFANDANCTVLASGLVYLMEPAWNPMLERQALDRVHRLGQTKEVIATRFIIEGSDSIEEHILRVQKRKSDAITASFEDANPSRDLALQGFLEMRTT